MSILRKPLQHQPFRKGRGYAYMMIRINRADLTKNLGSNPDPNLLAANTEDKSKLGRSWAPNSTMSNEEGKKISFSDISEEITKSIDALFTSGDDRLIGQANEFTTELNKLNKDLITYNEAKKHAQDTFHELQSKLSGKSQQSPTQFEEQKKEFKELPNKLKELEEGFDTLKEKVAAVRKPITRPRPE